MTRTIFSKYSNERQRRFQIRTDIVQNEQGDRTVRKYALKEEGKEHLLHIVDMYQGCHCILIIRESLFVRVF